MTDPLRLFRLDGDTAIVTGGANGIGLALSRALAQVGAHVAIVDLDEEGARSAADTIMREGGRAEGRRLDVTDETEIDRVFAEISEARGRLDVLVNNAGVALRRPSTDLSLRDWNTVVAVNMTGVFLCARAAARHMMGRGGRIVNMASIMGLSGGGLYPNISYQTTKGAVVNMTRALSVEWAGAGIRVNAVAPTWVRTRLVEGLLADPELVARMTAMMPLGRIAEPEDIVGAVLFLSSRASAMVTGHTLPVDGGFLAQ